MAEVTLTTAAEFIPEMWIDAVLNYVERRFRLKNQVTDLSALVKEKGDIIHIPRVTEETAASLTSGSAVTFGANTDPTTTLTINQHYYEAKRIGDIVKVQANPDLFTMYTRSIGYAIAKYVETYLAVSVIQAASGLDVTLGTDNQVTSAKLREGLQHMVDLAIDYTDGDTFFYCSPAAYMYVLGLDEFTAYTNIGGGTTPTPKTSGSLGQVYGMEVFASTDWDDDGGVGDETASVFHKTGVFFAMQLAPRVQSQYMIEYLSTAIVADVIFGAQLFTDTASDTNIPVVNFNNP